MVAEKEGFEPSRQLSHPTPLAGEPLRPLGYFSMVLNWRRERDSPGNKMHTGSYCRSNNFVCNSTYKKNGGESGIRTHGRSHVTGFQDRLFQPLRHLSD